VNSYFWLILGLWFTSEFNSLTALDEYVRPKTACLHCYSASYGQNVFDRGEDLVESITSNRVLKLKLM